MGMNDEIRQKVDQRLKEKGMTRADLARATGIHANHITRALNNTGGRGGNVPPVWHAILEALDLRLTVEAGAAPPSGGEEEKGQK